MFTFDSEWIWGCDPWLTANATLLERFIKNEVVYALYRLQVFNNENSDGSCLREYSKKQW